MKSRKNNKKSKPKRKQSRPAVEARNRRATLKGLYRELANEVTTLKYKNIRITSQNILKEATNYIITLRNHYVWLINKNNELQTELNDKQ